MNEYDQVLPVTDVKKDLLNLIKRLQKLQTSIAITRNGHPAAVLMSIEEYEGLLETVEILSDARLMKILKKSQKELKAGKTVPHEEVWGA